MRLGGQVIRTFCHGIRAVAVLALVPISSSFVHAAAPYAAVAGLESTRVADVVLLGDGFNGGLRQGMVCRVTRGSTEIGEVLLVELRPSCAAALILSVAPGQSIRRGDVATVKVLKS